MWWLLGTGAGLALALTTVGTFIIRHQRRAAALEARLTHAQEFAHLRERTEKLVENVSVGLIAVTTDGRVALTNRFLGERIADLPVGTLLAEALGAGDPEATERIRKTLAEALRSGRPRAVPEREVPLLASKPGHFDLRIIPLKQPAQDVNAMVLVEDLSELKSLEKQLVRAEKLITVGVLTAGLAHEIGTPLGIIRGRAEVLLTRIKDLAVARDLESMVRQIDSDHQLAHCQGRKRQELYALIERVAMVAHAGPHRLHRRDSDAVPAMRLLIEHSWPGNVRELEHLVQSMVVTSTTAEVGEEPLRASLRDVSSERILDRARRGLWSLRELEQEYIAWILEHTRGNKTRASEILGIDPSTLYRREGKAKS
jgi:DNA-binding protein Fis